jgi:putative alpha-1,2-mannosidase
VHFFLEAADRGGWIPEAPVNGGYSPVMVAQHQDALIVSSYQKGIRDFDAERAWRAIKHDLTTPGTPVPTAASPATATCRPTWPTATCPMRTGPTSNTFEYAYDDWCAAQFARRSAMTTTPAPFSRAPATGGTASIPQTKYARRRHADGRWVEPPDLFTSAPRAAGTAPGLSRATRGSTRCSCPRIPAGSSPRSAATSSTAAWRRVLPRATST